MKGWQGLLAAMLVAAPVAAAGPPDAPVARLAAAEAALAGAHEAEDRVAALANAVLAYERALSALRADVTAAAQRERALRLELAARGEEIRRLLAALQAVRRTPPPERAVHSAGPLAAARAEAMIAGLRPALQEEADVLAGSLEKIEAVRREYRAGMAALETGLGGLDSARSALRDALAAGVSPEAQVDASTVALVRESETLTALAAAFAGDGDASAAEPADGNLAWPVAGQVVAGFEARDAAGVRRPGIVIAAPPQALVSAPANAEVRYAGPFLDYGYVVVLAPRPGTLVVLAGLAELHAATGTSVRRGAILGLLGGRTPNADDYVMLTETGTGAGAEQMLYVEIRNGAGPVDPEPWFAGENG